VIGPDGVIEEVLRNVKPAQRDQARRDRLREPAQRDHGPVVDRVRMSVQQTACGAGLGR